MELNLLFIIGVLFFPLATVSLDNGVGRTPPLGWNSWNAFKGKLDEKVVKQTADLLVSTGLAAKGYVYVNMDDTWAEERDKVTHKLVASTKKFPSGIPSLASYVHSKGLKFGICTSQTLFEPMHFTKINYTHIYYLWTI